MPEDHASYHAPLLTRWGSFGQTEMTALHCRKKPVVTPPNAEWTKRRKGSSNPLIDTGFMHGGGNVDGQSLNCSEGTY